MGRRKPKLTRHLKARHIRWAALRGAVAVAPMLKRRIHFFGAGRSLEDAAEERLLVDETTVETPLAPDQSAFIEARCAENDRPIEPRYWEPPWRFRDEHFLLREVWMLGHTGRLADRDHTALLTDWGAPENWNRDRAARLARGADAGAAIVVPIRAYTSYFHFFMDVAVPLVAYFESAERPRAPHLLLSVEITRPFVAETLRAIAAAYGAELRLLGAREKAFCARAVAFRRTTPCSDWYPIRRPVADRLKAILAAHLERRLADGPSEGRIYLKRGPEKLRNLTNDAALDALLAARGYEIFTPAGPNFADQITKVDAAREIVAVHGAALANLLFARPGAAVTEIFDARFCKSVYLATAHMLGLRHRRSIGGAGDARQNFAADLDDLTRALGASSG